MFRCKPVSVRFRRRSLLLLCCLLLTLSLLSCQLQERATPAEAVEAMCRAEKPLPAGQLYCLSEQHSGQGEPLTRELIETAFGNGVYPPEMDGVTDAACFFSYSEACELSVFLCESATDAHSVANMCLRRLELLKRERPDCADILENATVTVRGRWTVLCVSSDPEAALRAFRRVL